jgi:hypothetical protein
MGSSMSLKGAFPSEIPPETARLVEGLLTDDSVYRVVAENRRTP